MKIQNSEGHIVEVPRHLRKKIKQMLDNNQHEEVTQMFAQGGIIPISNPSDKQAVNRFKDGGKTESYVNQYMGDYSKNEQDPGGYDNMRAMLETKHGLSRKQAVEIMGRLQNVMQKAPNQFTGNLKKDNFIYQTPEDVVNKNLRGRDARRAIDPNTLTPIQPFGYGQEQYKEGGSINNEPTRADSLALLNNTKSLENYYSKYNKSYSSAQDASEVNVHALNKNSADAFFTSGASVRVPRKDGTSMDLQRELFPKDQYYKKIDNNRYYQRELADRILDTRAPMALYDKRIAPNNLTAYLNDIPNDGMNGDGITIYGYDPLSVTPWDMLNSKDKANRISQFGVAGTPYKSVEEFQKANPAPVIQARKNNLEKMPIINKPLSINNNQQINPDSNVTVPKFQPYTASNNPNIAKGYYDLGQGKKIETFQDGGKPPLYGLGGTIGSLLSTAAPIASLIPGVGTAVGVGAGILGAGLQALDGPSGGSQGGSPQRGVPMHHMSNYAPTGFARGGETGLVPINIEGHNVKNISMSQAKKGELLVHQGRVHKNYISRPPHPSEGQNPLGNDEVAQGLIVIPKDRSKEYLNAGRALRKQIEASVVSQQVAREGNMMRKGGQAGRSKMLPGGMAEDYFDREYPYAPSLNPHVGYAQVEQVGNHYMEGDAYRNARAGLPASYNNMSPMTPRDPFNSGYDQNIRTQMSNNNNNPGPRGSIYNRTDGGTPGEQDSGMSSFDKLNLGQFGLSMIPAIGDIIDATASVQTPQFGSLRNVSPNLIDPNTGQSQINQAYRSGYNSLRDSGVYSLKSNRNLVADRMQRSGDQALNIANQNAQIKNQFVGMNTDINKYNLDMQNQVELYRMQGQAKRREARRNLLDRAPAAASQYMQNGLYAKMLGI